MEHARVQADSVSMNESSKASFALKKHAVVFERSGLMNIQLLVVKMTEARWVHQNNIKCRVESEYECYIVSEFAFALSMRQ